MIIENNQYTDGMTFREPYLSKNMFINTPAHYVPIDNNMMRTTSLADPSIMNFHRQAMDQINQDQEHDIIDSQLPVYPLKQNNQRDSAIALFESDEDEAYKNLEHEI